MELIDIEAIATVGEDPFILYRRVPDDDSQVIRRYGIHYNPGDSTVRLYTGFAGSPPLNASTISEGDILVDDVSNLTFNFFEGGAVWSGTDLRMLSSIEVILDLQRPEDASVVRQFRTIVHLRNTNNFGGATPTTRPVSVNDYACFISSFLTEQ